MPRSCTKLACWMRSRESTSRSSVMTVWNTSGRRGGFKPLKWVLDLRCLELWEPSEPGPRSIAVLRHFVVVREGVAGTLMGQMSVGSEWRREPSRSFWIYFGCILNLRSPWSVYLAMSFINCFDFFKCCVGPKGMPYHKEIRRKATQKVDTYASAYAQNPSEGWYPHTAFQPETWPQCVTNVTCFCVSGTKMIKPSGLKLSQRAVGICKYCHNAPLKLNLRIK